MASVPESFRVKLRRVNRRLRVRWSAFAGKFLIEEKLPVGKSLSPSGARHPDELVRRKEGYALVLTADKLDWRVFANLYYMDIGRFGGAQKYADWLEQEEAREERALNRSQRSRLDDVSHEAFDKVLWGTQNPEHSRASH